MKLKEVLPLEEKKNKKMLSEMGKNLREGKERFSEITKHRCRRSRAFERKFYY